MKKLFLTLTLLISTFLLSVSHVAAADVKTVSLDFPGKIPGPHFRAGDFVDINQDLSGDVYVAGGNVSIDAVIDGDLIVVGGTVSLNGEVTEDLRIVGGTLIINGQIGQDVTAAGGTINFSKESQVGGSVMTAGGSVNYDGKILGNVLTGAGQAKLAGLFGQNIQLETGTFQVASEASVGGDLKAKYEESSDVSEEAQIQGQTQVEKSQRSAQAKQAQDWLSGVSEGVDRAKVVTTTLMSLATGLLLIFLFPKISQKLGAQVMEKPVATFGWGLAKLFLAPIMMVLLLVTVLGVPLAGILFLLYLLSLMLATWVAAVAVGQKLNKELKFKLLKNPYWQFVTGLILIKLVGLVPLTGGLIKFVLFLMGLGSLCLWFKVQIKFGKSQK